MAKRAVRIAFVTGHVFGCRALEGILSSDAYLNGDVVVPLVIGLPEEAASETVGFQSPRILASTINAFYEDSEDGRLHSAVASLRRWEIDYLLVVGWSRLIPREVLRVPRGKVGEGFGAIGMHPTLLPSGRGRAPIPWTIINRLGKTGLSVFNLVDEADAGSLINQYEITVSERETATSLFHRFGPLHFTAGLELAELLRSQDWALRDQEPELVTEWAKRTPADSLVSSSLSKSEADRLIRAQQFPYPQAMVDLNDGRHPVYSMKTSEESFLSYGKREVSFSFRDGDAVLIIQ